MKKHITILTQLVLCLLFTVCIASDLFGKSNIDDFHYYSKDNVKIKNICEPVKNPSTNTKSVQSDLIGDWIYVTKFSSSSLSPNIELKSLAFRKNTFIEYSYELKGDKKTFSKFGSYQVIHKGARDKHPGVKPNIIVTRQDLPDNSLILFTEVSVDYDSRYPMEMGKVLKFKDPNGSEFFFVRDKAKGNQDSYEKDFVRQPDTNGGVKAKSPERLSNPAATKETVASLEEGRLTDYERNKAILRLMNEGDSSCVPVLLNHLSDKYPLVIRQNAIRALGKFGDKQATKPLLGILEKPVKGDIKDEETNEAIIRRSVVMALGEINDSSALSVLKRLSDAKQEYESVRDLAKITGNKIREK